MGPIRRGTGVRDRVGVFRGTGQIIKTQERLGGLDT